MFLEILVFLVTRQVSKGGELITSVFEILDGRVFDGWKCRGRGLAGRAARCFLVDAERRRAWLADGACFRRWRMCIDPDWGGSRGFSGLLTAECLVRAGSVKLKTKLPPGKGGDRGVALVTRAREGDVKFILLVAVFPQLLSDFRVDNADFGKGDF
eukprot:5843465-Pleurochrysis_carterae.AAC.2